MPGGTIGGCPGRHIAQPLTSVVIIMERGRHQVRRVVEGIGKVWEGRRGVGHVCSVGGTIAADFIEQLLVCF